MIETDQPRAAMSSSLASTKSTVWIYLVLNQVKYHQIPINFLFCLVLQPSSQLVGFKASNVRSGEVWSGQCVYIYVYMHIININQVSIKYQLNYKYNWASWTHMIISMVLNHVNDIDLNNGSNDIRSIYSINRIYWSDIRLIYQISL